MAVDAVAAALNSRIAAGYAGRRVGNDGNPFAYVQPRTVYDPFPEWNRRADAASVFNYAGAPNAPDVSGLSQYTLSIDGKTYWWAPESIEAGNKWSRAILPESVARAAGGVPVELPTAGTPYQYSPITGTQSLRTPTERGYLFEANPHSETLRTWVAGQGTSYLREFVADVVIPVSSVVLPAIGGSLAAAAQPATSSALVSGEALAQAVVPVAVEPVGTVALSFAQGASTAIAGDVLSMFSAALPVAAASVNVDATALKSLEAADVAQAPSPQALLSTPTPTPEIIAPVDVVAPMPQVPALPAPSVPLVPSAPASIAEQVAASGAVQVAPASIVAEVAPTAAAGSGVVSTAVEALQAVQAGAGVVQSAAGVVSGAATLRTLLASVNGDTMTDAGPGYVVDEGAAVVGTMPTVEVTGHTQPDWVFWLALVGAAIMITRL